MLLNKYNYNKFYLIKKNYFNTNNKVLKIRYLSNLLIENLFKNVTKDSKYTLTESYVKLLRNSLIPFVLFLRMHSFIKATTLIDINVMDFPGRVYRFNINYFLLSISNNLRWRISLYTNEVIWLPTITTLFDNGNWLERECWDTFGVCFLEHPDLRRILTDYGFLGFPFRKDFPITGFQELRYQEINKCFKYVSVKNLRYRKFKYALPWQLN